MKGNFDLSSFYAGIFVAIVAFVILIGLANVDNGPNCPAEDSCYADYYGGKWHIIEGER